MDFLLFFFISLSIKMTSFRIFHTFFQTEQSCWWMEKRRKTHERFYVFLCCFIHFHVGFSLCLKREKVERKTKKIRYFTFLNSFHFSSDWGKIYIYWLQNRTVSTYLRKWRKKKCRQIKLDFLIFLLDTSVKTKLLQFFLCRIFPAGKFSFKSISGHFYDWIWLIGK